MPWTAADAKKHFKGLTRKESRVWAAVANSAFETCTKRGGDNCEGYAIATASGQINKRRKEGGKAMEEMNKGSKTMAETPYQPAADESDEDYEMGGGTTMENMAGVPWGVKTFEDLDAMDAAEELKEEVSKLTNQFNGMLNNIIGGMGEEGAGPLDKIGAVRMLAGQYIARLEQLLQPGATEEESEPATPSEPVRENEPVLLQESYVGDAHLETATIEEAGAKSPMVMDVVLIRPGWGNKVSNYFYDKKVLEKASQRFVGAKMYETDHVQKEKSTRTWVSTVKEIAGFTSDGAPIGRVVVHDPNFAERVSNLAKAGMLDKMECSIFANGKVGEAYTDGQRKGTKIDDITEVSSVDWVTRAGAGGHALNISESAEEGANTMDVKQPGADSVGPVEQTVDDKKTEPEQTTTAPAEAAAPVVVPVTENVPTPPAVLAEAEVGEVLQASGLPEAAITRLGEQQYHSQEELVKAIAAEREYLIKVTGSGKITGMGSTSRAVTPQENTAKVAEVAKAVNTKYFGRS